MKNFLASAALALTLFSSSACFADTGVLANVGSTAPNFEAQDTNGAQVSLASLKGKTVVLEWTNNECPFVHKHYDSGNMQKLQKTATDDGIVWISIVSSADNKEGYVTKQQANDIAKKQGAQPSHIILDSSGIIGHEYGAKTTPHMFVIDKNGVLAYAGAIDDQPNTDAAAIDKADNYVMDALAALKKGDPVNPDRTNPYGCGVKY